MVTAWCEYVLGRYRLQPGRQLLGDGAPVRIGAKALDIFSTLVEAAGNVVTKEELLERVWSGLVVEEHTIQVHVSALRKALGPEAQWIATVPGRGYRFIGPVALGASPARPFQIASPAAAARNPEPAGLPPNTIDASRKGKSWPQSAERRQLTIMLCGLTESTSLSSRLDPEEFHRVIAAYWKCCTAVISRFGGIVAKLQTDGIVAYFGYPQAHEHHAEQAIRAGLSVVGAVTNLDIGLNMALHAHIGIATGQVVAGEFVGEDMLREHAVLGEAPNLAARLLSVAGPATVLISASTRRLVGGLFDLRGLAPAALDGFANLVHAFQVFGVSGAESRFAALHGTPLSPLIGREEELDLLLRRWQQAKQGEGQLVLISGEPGIGKSRLIAALEEQLSTEPHADLLYFSSPHHQDSALYPVITSLEHEAGFRRGDLPNRKLDRLEAIISCESTPAEDMPLIAELLLVPFGDRYPALNYSRQRIKEKTFQALIRRLVSIARRQTVFALFEDVHWADPSSLELLDMAVRVLTDLPVLLVVSFRAEFQAPWIGRAATSLITLKRLNRRQTTQLIAEVALESMLPPALIERIVAQTDGVPLFIEELTKTVLESLGQPNCDEVPLAVPPTLQASLMARLDRLPAAKQIAQFGAVIGREFPHALLAAVARMPDAQLAQGLDELVASGLAFRRGERPDAVYGFKHALVQDAAYDSLLRGRRVEVHAAVVDALERDAEIAARQPAQLGYHCAQAGRIGKAATYYRLAGGQSEERSAYAETRALVDRGLTLCATLPGSPDCRRLEAELLLALGRVLHMTKGFGDSEAILAIGRAIDLFRTLDSTEALTSALRDRSVNFLLRGDLEDGWRDGQELLSVAENTGNTKARLFAHLALGNFRFVRGRFIDARVHQETAEELYSRVSDAHFDATDIGWIIGGRCFLAHTLACLGHLQQAAAVVAATTDEARHATPFNRASAVAHFCRFALITRDMAALQGHTASLTSIAQEQGFSLWITLARFYRAILEARDGHARPAIHEMQAVLAVLHAVGMQFFGPYNRFLLADTLICAGQTGDALTVLDDGLAVAARTGESWFNAELHRRKGELLLADPELDPRLGEQQLLRALGIARDQTAKLFELRAAVSLARLWSSQGRRAAAHNLLAPVYRWFIEGFETSDLMEARSLLED